MSEYKYLGNFAACEPWAAQGMSCDDCMVSWTGCWDNFQCPRCGKGELPRHQCERFAAQQEQIGDSRMATVKSYDQRCYDLAAIFLGDEPTIHNEANIHAMALEIQQTIEDEIYYMLNPDALGVVGKAGKS